jgi:hypothetical protein
MAADSENRLRESIGIVRTSENAVKAKFAFWAFSEVAHSPGPIQQDFLCKDLEGRGPAYIRL